MGRFVAISSQPKGGTTPTEKYVKQTYDALSNVNIDLERVAMQISQLPVREQHKFFRLLINYVDLTAEQANRPHWSTMNDIIALCEKLIDVVNDHYADQDQLTFEGM